MLLRLVLAREDLQQPGLLLRGGQRLAAHRRLAPRAACRLPLRALPPALRALPRSPAALPASRRPAPVSCVRAATPLGQAWRHWLRLPRDQAVRERLQNPHWKLPTLVIAVASDGTPMLMGIPKEMGDVVVRGERVVAGGQASMNFEVVRRYVAWVGAEDIQGGGSPLLCLPMALGRGNAPTIFRAWEMSDPFDEADFEMFGQVLGTRFRPKRGSS